MPRGATLPPLARLTGTLLTALVAATLLRQDLAALEARVRRSPNAANLRALADAAVAARRFDRASEAFALAATKYERLGDPNAAKVLRGLADRYRTELTLLVAADPPRGVELARFEPPAGCYLGAFVDREDGVRSLVADGRRHGDPQAFGEAVGKPHALFFTYLRLGSPFPRGWCRGLRSLEAGAQIAVEPTSLAQGSDEATLRRLGRDIRAAGLPVFVRFASEMNGPWTPYSGDPAGYRAMFAKAARVIREEAPNAAMVWCPNETPEPQIPSYYPGPESVDWVGVNFYSVLYNDGDRSRGATWRDPLDALDFVYRRYASRRPIMVGEWGASHRSVVDGLARPDFARAKIGRFYGALPLRYPRVKAVHWLSMDTEKYAQGSRRLNDFSLLDDAAVRAKYAEAVASPYYLSKIPDAAPFAWAPAGATAKPGDLVAVGAKSYVISPTVEVRVNGDLVRRTTEPGEISLALPEARAWTVEVRALDNRGALAGRRVWRLKSVP